jgi:hypothetical protein
MGAFLCLLALTLALFGHVEAPQASPFAGQSTAVMLDHSEGVAEHSAETIPHHCVHQSQCSVPAILPSDNFPDALGVTRTKLAADLRGTSRAISPHGHPPKISFPE